MPPRLTDYRLADWPRLRPLTHAVKTWRYQRVTDRFTRRPPREGDLAEIRHSLAGRQAMVTIAFNDPTILEQQLRAIRTFTPGPALLVADNSSRADSNAENQAHCEHLGVRYVRLPINPWSAKSPSRSHGLAIDWVWRQVILPARPQAFGFLDHDLIPIAPDDPFDGLSRQPVAGDIRTAGPRWYLWAGFCFFNFDVLQARRVSFGQDWFLGLDTGGGNWDGLYSRLDRAAIHQRDIVQCAVFEDRPLRDCYFERRGNWLHEVGLDGREDLRAEKRRVFLALIEGALADASPPD